jgi:hypothetical protein
MKFLVLSFLINSCVTVAKPHLTLQSVSLNPFTDEVYYKPCRSFLIDDILYHHSGKILDLRTFKVIARIPSDQNIEKVIYEGPGGDQIHRMGNRFELSLIDLVETLEF